jgi:acyl carrier protein
MTDATIDAAAIQDWCVNYIARIANMPVGQVDPSVEIDHFGLDSAMAVALIMELEEWLDIELAPELLFEYPTVAGLSVHLASRLPPAAKVA